MKLTLGAVALAAGLLTSAGAASADVVVFQQTGNVLFLNIDRMGLPDAGKYRFEFTASLPVLVQISAGYKYHYDTFLAPAPRPHGEYIEGNDYDVSDGLSEVSTIVDWDFTVPETSYRFFNAQGLEWIGVPDGTPLYEEVKFENSYFSIFADYNDFAAPFDYTLTVTRLSAIPEPATWAMMIVGFGLAGAGLRSARSKPLDRRSPQVAV